MPFSIRPYRRFLALTPPDGQPSLIYAYCIY
jgi:hypothetical protein